MKHETSNKGQCINRKRVWKEPLLEVLSINETNSGTTKTITETTNNNGTLSAS